MDYAVHVIPAPDFNEKRGYVGLISFGAFESRQLLRHVPKAELRGRKLPPLSPTFRVYNWVFDWKMHKKFSEKAMGYDHYATIPNLQHASIWDFYKFIGYAYKTNTWSPPPTPY